MTRLLFSAFFGILFAALCFLLGRWDCRGDVMPAILPSAATPLATAEGDCPNTGAISCTHHDIVPKTILNEPLPVSHGCRQPFQFAVRDGRHWTICDGTGAEGDPAWEMDDQGHYFEKLPVEQGYNGPAEDLTDQPKCNCNEDLRTPIH